MINTEMITSVSSHYLRKVNILSQEKNPSIFKGETKINKMLDISLLDRSSFSHI